MEKLPAELFIEMDYLWEQKMLKDYPDLVRYHLPGMTYRKQYETLYVLPPIQESILNRRLDQLILHFLRGNEPEEKDLNVLTAKGMTVS